MGYDENGTKFTLAAGGNKIIGFHGSAETNLMSLGAYFITLPPIKMEQQGGCGGHPWDHGIYNGVRKVYVTYSPSGISHIMVEYDKVGKQETRESGDRLGENRVQGQQKEVIIYTSTNSSFLVKMLYKVYYKSIYKFYKIVG